MSPSAVEMDNVYWNTHVSPDAFVPNPTVAWENTTPAGLTTSTRLAAYVSVVESVHWYRTSPCDTPGSSEFFGYPASVDPIVFCSVGVLL